MSSSLTEDQISQILEELRAGKKIVAVKLCRQMTGCSLVEAKHRVEQLAAGNHTPSVSVRNDPDGLEMDEVLDAIEAGKKLNAVKLYMGRSGLSLKESKEFIERLMEELDIDQEESSSKGGGCAGAVLLAFLFMSTLFAAAISNL